jgi:hypothetical protein
MERESNSLALVPLNRESGLQPVISPASSLQVLGPERRGLAKWVNWLVSHPVARLGTAVVVLAAGAYLSRRNPGGVRISPFRPQSSKAEMEAWVVTGVGLSVRTDCQDLSIWSISGFRPRR